MNFPRTPNERTVIVQTGSIRVEVRGVMALVIAYLAGTEGLARDLDGMANGELHIMWGPGGPFKAKIEKYYRPAGSSSLMGESS